jgi:hypothetical protein
MPSGELLGTTLKLTTGREVTDGHSHFFQQDRMSFSQFRLRLSEQMLRYDPSNGLYAGNNKFRRTTHMHKMRRKGSKDFSAEEFPETGVTLTNLRAAGINLCNDGTCPEALRQYYQEDECRTM